MLPLYDLGGIISVVEERRGGALLLEATTGVFGTSSPGAVMVNISWHIDRREWWLKKKGCLQDKIETLFIDKFNRGKAKAIRKCKGQVTAPLKGLFGRLKG